MRPRKKKHCAERMEKQSFLFFTEDDADRKNINLEIGTGKGSFICGMAEKHPDSFFLGAEKVADVLVMAMEKTAELGLSNVKFICEDAKLLGERLGEGSVETIYLNFSDPWPKKKHTGRRLTSAEFLCVYKKMLCEGGRIKMKTDNTGLFDFSLEELEKNGFEIAEISRNLPPEGLDGENVITEYESNFRNQGISINYLCAVKKDRIDG